LLDIDRYPETVGDVPVWFSGSKGFHVAVELAHKPPPAVAFPRTPGRSPKRSLTAPG
jgi:hypothetical protein